MRIVETAGRSPDRYMAALKAVSIKVIHKCTSVRHVLKAEAVGCQGDRRCARQPTMRFVAIKSVEQQAILAWHSVREGWQEEGTALLDRSRGLLAEFGVVIACSADCFISALRQLIEDARLPDPVRAMLLEVREQLAALNLRLARYDRQIASHARGSDVARRASELLGVGLPTPSALAAMVPQAKVFRNGRQFGT